MHPHPHTPPPLHIRWELDPEGECHRSGLDIMGIASYHELTTKDYVVVESLCKSSTLKHVITSEPLMDNDKDGAAVMMLLEGMVLIEIVGIMDERMSYRYFYPFNDLLQLNTGEVHKS